MPDGVPNIGAGVPPAPAGIGGMTGARGLIVLSPGFITLDGTD